MAMNFAKQLRKRKVTPPKQKTNTLPKLVLLLDDIYDTYNVGGMYRVGDAAGVSKIYHCGATAKIPNPKISRAAVGLEQYLAHEDVDKITTIIPVLKKQGYTVIALEQTPQAQSYYQAHYQGKIALVAGNETFGISQEALALCDLTVELPMFGANKSLNVVVATGIVLYQIRLCLLGLI